MESVVHISTNLPVLAIIERSHLSPAERAEAVAAYRWGKVFASLLARLFAPGKGNGNGGAKDVAIDPVRAAVKA
jgi:hypothetical protein